MDELIGHNLDQLPAMKEFVGRAFVLLADDAVLEASTFVEDLLLLRQLGIHSVVVASIDHRHASARLVGLVNRVGGEAVAIDGTSASTIVVAPDAEGKAAVRSVNTSLLSLLLEQRYIAVFTSQASSLSGAAEPLDAVDAARELAAAIHAKRLLYPSETGGIRVRDHDIIGELTSSEALELASGGTLTPPQSRRLEAAALGVRGGVDAAQLLDLCAAHAPLVELLTAKHLGTQVTSHVII